MRNQNCGTVWEMTNFAQVITLIGAGGKTTTLQALTNEIQALGKKVLATTTTKVYPLPFEGVWKDDVFPPPEDYKYPCFWYAKIFEGGTESFTEGVELTTESLKIKWEGPSGDVVDRALELRELKTTDKALRERVWIIEGDGAREKKLKCWDSHEPQIPLKSRCAILVIPRELWGKKLTHEDIHREEKCPNLVGRTWDDELGARYILNSPVFYPRYRHLPWIVLLNEAELSPRDLDNPIQFSIRHFLYSQARSVSSRPAHLRIATGNVKEGTLRWYDMW